MHWFNTQVKCADSMQAHKKTGYPRGLPVFADETFQLLLFSITLFGSIRCAVE